MKVILAPQALEDLQAAVEYLLDRNPEAASALVDRVFDLAEQLATGDFAGPVAALSTGEEVRSWPMPPFRLYYERDAHALVVLRVYHQSRRPL